MVWVISPYYGVSARFEPPSDAVPDFPRESERDRLQPSSEVPTTGVEDAGRTRKRITMPELITIEQCCKLLKLSDRTVYGMLRAGRLPGGCKVAGQWRVDKDKLLVWLANGGELEQGTKTGA